ncbi:MAG: T9SS type A sorting domain-containing protein [Saprospiraceae bacterium]
MKFQHVLKTQILIILLYWSGAFAKGEVVCSVTNFQVVIDQNTCNGEIVDFTFTFDATDFGANGFTLSSPAGIMNYEIGDPYQSSVIALCAEDTEWTITDNDNPSCSTTILVPPICCPCEYTADVIEFFCGDNNIFCFFNIFESEGSCVNYYPEVYFQGQLIDSNYPLNYFMLPGTYDETIDFEICSGVPGLQECIPFSLENPCLGYITTFLVYDNDITCDENNANVTIYLDGVISEDYPVTVTTSLGTSEVYNSSGFYTLVLPALCNGPITIQANNYNNSIILYSIINKLCCPCSTEFSIENQACTDGQFNLIIAQGNTFGTCASYPWTASLNDTTYLLHDIEINNYYEIENIQSNDSILLIEICNVSPIEYFCTTQTIQNPCYNLEVDTCSLLSFQIVLDSSVCLQDSMRLPFTYHSTDTTDFMYIIRSSLGTIDTIIAGTTEYITVPSPCDSMVVFTMYDPNFIDCVVHDTIQTLCCPCEFDVDVMAMCNGQMPNISIELDSIWGNCFGDSLVVSLNGTSYIWAGSAPFAHDVTVSSQVDSIDISVCHKGLNTTCFSLTIANPCYTAPVCTIGNLQIDSISDCINDNGARQLVLSFFAQNFGQNGFIINTDSGLDSTYILNGNEYTVVLPSLCIDDRLYISDAKEPSCSATLDLPKLCCPCQSNFSISSSGCNGGAINPIITLENSGTCGFYDWNLTINGDPTSMMLVDGQYEVDAINSLDSLLKFVFCSTHPTQSYCDTVTFVNPCYTSIVPCSIADVSFQIDTTQCAGDSLPVTISFQSQNFGSQGFTITDPNGRIWPFSNSNTPVNITLLADCANSQVLNITDDLDPSCGSVIALPSLCCPCSMTFTPQLQPCNEEGFEVLIAFDTMDGSCVYGDWTININGSLVTFTETNAGLMIDDQILVVDSVLTIEVCSQLPTGQFCDQVTITNPCPILIGTQETTLDDLITFQTLPDGIFVHNKSDADLTFTVYDISGRTFLEPKNIQINADFRVSTTSFQNGVYILSIQQDDAVFLKSFVIIK